MNQNEPIIRHAEAHDYSGVNDVFIEAEALHRRALPHIFRRSSDVSFDRDYFASLRDNPDAALLVADVERQIAGFVVLSLRYAPDTPVHQPRCYAVVDFLGVRERARRRGIGRALMAQGRQWARERGATAIELNVWEFNRTAIEFYERLGYSAASRKMWLALKPMEYTDANT